MHSAVWEAEQLSLLLRWFSFCWLYVLLLFFTAFMGSLFTRWSPPVWHFRCALMLIHNKSSCILMMKNNDILICMHAPEFHVHSEAKYSNFILPEPHWVMCCVATFNILITCMLSRRKNTNWEETKSMQRAGSCFAEDAFITHRPQFQPWGLSAGLIKCSKTYCVADCNLPSSEWGEVKNVSEVEDGRKCQINTFVTLFLSPRVKE